LGVNALEESLPFKHPTVYALCGVEGAMLGANTNSPTLFSITMSVPALDKVPTPPLAGPVQEYCVGTKVKRDPDTAYVPI
jgi:hypothetical protein